MSTSNSVSSLVQPLGETPPEAIVFGVTEAMRALRERLAKIAGANVPVLIQGESGTGKDNHCAHDSRCFALKSGPG